MGLVDYGSSSEDEDNNKNNSVAQAPASPPIATKPGSSLFSALPAPKQGKITNNNETNKRKEVTVKIPIATSAISKKDDDDEWEEDAGTGPEKKRRMNSGIASALSFLPAPKNDLTKPAPQKIEPKPSSTNIPKPSAPLLKPEFNGEDEKDDSIVDTSSTKNEQPATNTSSSTSKLTNGKKPPIKAKTSAQPQRRIALSFKQQAFAELLKSQPEDEPQQPIQEEQPAEIQEEANDQTTPSTEDPSYLPPYQDGSDASEQTATQGYYGQQQYAQYGGYAYPQAVAKAPPVDPRTLPRAFREMLQNGNAEFTEVKQDNLRHSFFNYSAPDAETFYKPRPAMEEGLTHNHKRQNHASYLVWDMQNKVAALEQKRADSRRTKMESRSKYGW